MGVGRQESDSSGARSVWTRPPPFLSQFMSDFDVEAAVQLDIQDVFNAMFQFEDEEDEVE